jgi:hypothetical protein
MQSQGRETDVNELGAKCLGQDSCWLVQATGKALGGSGWFVKQYIKKNEATEKAPQNIILVPNVIYGFTAHLYVIGFTCSVLERRLLIHGGPKAS